MTSGPSISIKHLEDFKFVLDFGESFENLLVDEAPPVGAGQGPTPEQLLLAGVTNCLCASLLFALAKFKQSARGLEASSKCRIERNEEGRFRIAEIDVDITLAASAHEMPRIDRVIEQFERFCTVSESVKAGVVVNVKIQDGFQQSLK